MILGLLLIISSVVVISHFDSISRSILGEKLVLAPHSGGPSVEKAMSDDYVRKVAWYFFNLTNPDDFKKGKTPIVNEVGPFWYR